MVDSLKGHASTVRNLAFSADGSRLASTCAELGDVNNETVRVWDRKSGRPVAQFSSGQFNVTLIALSPDASRLALGTYQGVRVWDVATLPSAAAPEEDAPAEVQKPEDRAAAEWVLKQGGTVQARAEGAFLDVNNLDALPQEPFRVTAVDLGGKPITDAGLENLKGLTVLKVLTLNDTPISGEGLRHLLGSTRLEHLNPRHSKQLTDAGFARVGELTNLTELHLNLTPITDASLSHLKGLTRVRVLNLGATAVTDAGLESLKNWAKLRVLLLEATNVNGTGLAHLKASKGLAVLYLQGCPITDEGLAQVAGFPTLAELYLDGKDVPLTDAGLAALEGMKNLQQLRLAGKLTDAGLVHLKGLPRLRNLFLDNLPITDVGLEHLNGLKLGIVSLQNTKVTKEGEEKFRKSLPKAGGGPPGT
jgi:hypothetical protein